MLRRFGFGARTELDLPAEAEGMLRHYKRWYDMDAATISFGQGMSATSVQLASAMAAIANGGRLMKPLLVSRVTDAQGNVVEELAPSVRRQVVPSHVARLVGDMLTGVTAPGGTGEAAAMEGYLVAGKTGTAQKADFARGGYAADAVDRDVRGLRARQSSAPGDLGGDRRAGDRALRRHHCGARVSAHRCRSSAPPGRASCTGRSKARGPREEPAHREGSRACAARLPRLRKVRLPRELCQSSRPRLLPSPSRQTSQQVTKWRCRA